MLRLYIGNKNYSSFGRWFKSNTPYPSDAGSPVRNHSSPHCLVTTL